MTIKPTSSRGTCGNLKNSILVVGNALNNDFISHHQNLLSVYI